MGRHIAPLGRAPKGRLLGEPVQPLGKEGFRRFIRGGRLQQLLERRPLQDAAKDGQLLELEQALQPRQLGRDGQVTLSRCFVHAT